MVIAVSRRPPARARRLVHLAIDQNRALQHAGFAHFGPEFVAFAGALADASENGNAPIFLDHGVDQLHHQHGLADAGAAEHRRLAALGERGQQVDYLDAGLENLGRGCFVFQPRRRAMDRPAQRIGRQRGAVVADVAEHVEQPAEHGVAHRDGQGRAGRLNGDAARQAGCRLKRDGANGAVSMWL